MSKVLIRRLSILVLASILLTLAMPTLIYAYGNAYVAYSSLGRLYGFVYAKDPYKVKVKVTTPGGTTTISNELQDGIVSEMNYRYDDKNNKYKNFSFSIPYFTERPLSVSIEDSGLNYNLVKRSDEDAFDEAMPAPVRLGAYRLISAHEYFTSVTSNTYLKANDPIVSFTQNTDGATALMLQFPSTVTASTYIDFSKASASDFILKDLTSNTAAVIENVYGTPDYQDYAVFRPVPHYLNLTVQTPLLKDHTYKLEMSGTSGSDEIRSAGLDNTHAFTLSTGTLNFTAYSNLSYPFQYFLTFNTHFFNPNQDKPVTEPGGSNGNNPDPGSGGGTAPPASAPESGTQTPAAPGPDVPEPTIGSNGVTISPEGTEQSADGKKYGLYLIDDSTFIKALELAKDLDGSASEAIVIDLNDSLYSSDRIRLSAASLEEASQSLMNGVLKFMFNDGAYELPLKSIDWAALGGKLDTSLDKVTLSIEKETLDKASIPKQEGISLLSNPVDYKIVAIADGKSFELQDFNNRYIAHSIIVPSVLDKSKTAVFVYDPATKQSTFIPAVVTVDNGKTIVTAQRIGNSIYAVGTVAQAFADTDGHWAKSSVDPLAAKGLINGVDSDRFAPDLFLTRSQMAALLVRALGIIPKTDAGSSGFKDVGSADWFAPYVKAAIDAKLVSGYEDGSFRPSATITREEITVMIYRALQFVNKTKDETSGDPLGRFSDSNAISGWAKPAADEAVRAGLINGVTESEFSPGSNVDRAQAAVILNRFLTYIGFMN